MAQLWPLLSYCEFFMKFIFCTKFLICVIILGFRKSGLKYILSSLQFRAVRLNRSCN